MSTKISSTAVLLFNYSEKQKASLKKIAPAIGEKKLNGLINQLNRKAKKVANAAKLPFFQVNANLDSDFGEQLYSAYQQLFEQGYQSVIGISNDCPDFNEKDLKQAEHFLAQKKVVLGPAKDGGLYLFGIEKDTLTKKEFLNLGWQTNSLFERLEKLAIEKNYTTEVLTEKADMDTEGEFYKAFKSHHQFLINFKNQLFSYCKRKFKALSINLSLVQLRTQSLRAPPVFI